VCHNGKFHRNWTVRGWVISHHGLTIYDTSCRCRCWWHICAAGTNSSRPSVVRACFCSIRSVRRSLTRTTLLTLVVSSRTCGQKGGLLQLRSLGYFRTTVTTTAVCHQCRRSSRVLGEEVRAHNSTLPSTTLAESSAENSVSVMCSRISLP